MFLCLPALPLQKTSVRSTQTKHKQVSLWIGIICPGEVGLFFDFQLRPKNILLPFSPSCIAYTRPFALFFLIRRFGANLSSAVFLGHIGNASVSLPHFTTKFWFPHHFVPSVLKYILYIFLPSESKRYLLIFPLRGWILGKVTPEFFSNQLRGNSWDFPDRFFRRLLFSGLLNPLSCR